ncbi:hypothetical protein [Niabella soli]|uniref:Uncharacterized protein n=1 Tax=Niabella soli DSM 19437 TaxID=929713 RepID=W0F7M8_9BACT|nr:hypothetical protein [Niabella soli]AHF17469.1 hypothetical protein NIASO_08245 [Niabella soli DSM 19437]
MNRIQITYKELFRLAIAQPFYRNGFYRSNGTEPDVQLLTAPDTVDLLRRLNLLVRNDPANSGIIVLARAAGTNAAGDALLRFLPTPGTVLTFLMLLNNPELANFDELPLQTQQENTLYFTNNVSDPAAPRDDLHLSKAPEGVDGLNDTIKVSDVNYRFHHSTTVTAGAAVVKESRTGQVIQPSAVINAGGQCDLVFDLSGSPMGTYTLLISGTPVDTFYYLGAAAGQRVFGIVEISLDSALATNYRAVEADRSLTADRPFYQLRFKNRETFWRYTILLQQTSPVYLEMAAMTSAQRSDFISKVNIVSNDTSMITFNMTTASDTEWVFESVNKLALQEKYTGASNVPLQLSLKKNVNDVSTPAKVVKDNLPFPSTGNLDATAPPKIYSDVFMIL